MAEIHIVELNCIQEGKDCFVNLSTGFGKKPMFYTSSLTEGRGFHKKRLQNNKFNINDFIHDLMDIGLYSAVIDAKTTPDAWRDWSNAFNTVVNKHVKIKEIRVKARSNPWMNNEILALIYKRAFTHHMAVRLSSSDKMNEYKKLRKLVISTIRNSQRSYYKKTITANKPCDVWKAVNQSLRRIRKVLNIRFVTKCVE